MLTNALTNDNKNLIAKCSAFHNHSDGNTKMSYFLAYLKHMLWRNCVARRFSDKGELKFQNFIAWNNKTNMSASD